MTRKRFCDRRDSNGSIKRDFCLRTRISIEEEDAFIHMRLIPFAWDSLIAIAWQSDGCILINLGGTTSPEDALKFKQKTSMQIDYIPTPLGVQWKLIYCGT